MLNANCLKHPALISKIDAAMRQAIWHALKNKSGLGWAPVNNAKGETLMHVRYSRLHALSDMRFFDKHLQEITTTVHAALRSNKEI